VTLAPELPGSLALITHLRETYPALVISLGHSTADFATGLAALSCGADALTHVFNVMPPLHHREPGLAGLILKRK
jgi:N-acetylglucosamine-6-phosphate deacetylase